jgi:alpha-tubulin suppressor-like RCC1 family protein
MSAFLNGRHLPALVLLLASGLAPALASGAVLQVSAALDRTCALKSTAKVACWGNGALGYLGYESLDDIGDDESPGTVGDVQIGGTVTQISVGYDHTCALLDTGKVRCWGDGSFGQLGYGSTDNVGLEDTPERAGDVNIGTNVTQIAAGDGFTCALLVGGGVRCWGDGSFGHLGYGNTNSVGDEQTPASVGNLNLGGTATAITVGAEHACALLSGGTVRCWGHNFAGELGYANLNDVGDNETPATLPTVNVGSTVTQITAGEFHTCALLNTGAVRCWGAGDFGELGYGNLNDIGDNETPASLPTAVNVGGRVVEISAGSEHTCALLDTGAVRCWGSGAHGELGYGNLDNIGDTEAPAAAGDIVLGGPALHITAGGEHSCALMTTGDVRCWGRGTNGELGYGNTADIGDDETPSVAGTVHLSPTGVPLPPGASFGYALGLLGIGTLLGRCPR